MALNFGIVVGVCVAADLFLPEPINLAFASGLYCVFSFLLSLHESRNTVLKMNPVAAIQWAQTGMLGVAPFYVSMANVGRYSTFFNGQPLSVSDIAEGHAIMVVGAWAFYVGMKQFQPLEEIRNCLPAAESALLIALGVGSISGIQK